MADLLDLSTRIIDSGHTDQPVNRVTNELSEIADDLAVVESFKAASDVYAPVSGEVIEGNAALASAPETVNADPEGEGWFARIKVSDASEVDGLMDRAAYDQFLTTL